MGMVISSSSSSNIYLDPSSGLVRVDGSILPDDPDAHNLGSYENDWYCVYSQTFYDTGMYAFDEANDLDLIRAIGSKKTVVSQKKRVQVGTEKRFLEYRYETVMDGDTARENQIPVYQDEPVYEIVDDPATTKEVLMVDTATLPADLKDDSGRGIHLGNFISLCAGAIKALAEERDKDKADLAALKAEVQELRKQNAEPA